MSIKFLVLGGGGFGFLGGGSADFIFMGARIFLSLRVATKLFRTFVWCLYREGVAIHPGLTEGPSTEGPSTQESHPHGGVLHD